MFPHFSFAWILWMSVWSQPNVHKKNIIIQDLTFPDFMFSHNLFFIFLVTALQFTWFCFIVFFSEFLFASGKARESSMNSYWQFLYIWHLFRWEQIKFDLTLVSSDRLYKEVLLCIFSLELCMNVVDQIILWTECNFTEEGQKCTKESGNHLQWVIE